MLVLERNIVCKVAILPMQTLIATLLQRHWSRMVVLLLIPKHALCIATDYR